MASAEGDGGTAIAARGSEEVVGDVGMRAVIRDKERHFALHAQPTEPLSHAIPADVP